MFTAIYKSLVYSTHTQAVAESALWRAATTIRVERELLWNHTFEEAAAWSAVLQNSLPIQHGVIGEAVSYMWDGGVEDFDGLWEACDADSGDLETVASLLNSVEFTDSVEHDYFTRVVILDAVNIAPAFRVRGLGLKAAALSVFTSGGHSEFSLVASVPGERELDGPAPATIIRAGNLLLSLGLTEYHTADGSLFAGLTANAAFSAKIRSIVETTRC